jgi:hypothetical protein
MTYIVIGIAVIVGMLIWIGPYSLICARTFTVYVAR